MMDTEREKEELALEQFAIAVVVAGLTMLAIDWYLHRMRTVDASVNGHGGEFVGRATLAEAYRDAALEEEGL